MRNNQSKNSVVLINDVNAAAQKLLAENSFAASIDCHTCVGNLIGFDCSLYFYKRTN